MATKLQKIANSDHHMVVWWPLTTEPTRITTRALHRLKVQSLGYIILLIIWVCLLSNVHSEFQNTHYLCIRVQYSRSRWSKVVDFGTNWKGMWDFVVVINCNLGAIAHHFWNTATYWLKTANFLYPLSSSSLSRGDPFRICRKLLHILVTGLRGPDSKGFVILACVTFIGQQGVMDR